MSIVKDAVKIHFVEEGYLKNIPYHLISDDEMLSAFISVPYVEVSPEESDAHPEYVVKDGHYECNGYPVYNLSKRGSVSYFHDNYPCVDPSMEEKYETLISGILNAIHDFRQGIIEGIPDYIYSYMLDSTIGPSSSAIDIHDCLTLMNLDNLEDEFNLAASNTCYKLSVQWLRKQNHKALYNRPPTIFAEPHVIKSLRLMQSSTR